MGQVGPCDLDGYFNCHVLCYYNSYSSNASQTEAIRNCIWIDVGVAKLVFRNISYFNRGDSRECLE